MGQGGWVGGSGLGEEGERGRWTGKCVRSLGRKGWSQALAGCLGVWDGKRVLYTDGSCPGVLTWESPVGGDGVRIIWGRDV